MLYAIQPLMKGVRTLSLLRDLRLKHGLTQAELATKVHRTKSFVSHIENGDALPGRQALQSLAEVLNVPMQTLLDSMTVADPALEREIG